MKLVNEKIGYIDKNQFKLTTVVNTIVEFLCSKDEIQWSSNYEVQGKPNIKDIDGFQYKTFMFDLNNKKLGFIKIILVNITDPKVESYKFEGFVNEDDAGFYSPVDSNVDKGKNNCGYIYISYNALSDLISNVSELKDELESLLYHELRHYYDNIIGVFDGSIKELIHITLIADELNINNKEFLIQMKLNEKDTSYNSLKKLLYVSLPTELNAWYHSFVANMLSYVKKHPELTKDEVKAYMNDEQRIKHEDDHACFIYQYATVYKSLDNYSYVINKLCGKDPLKLFYYISNTLTECNPSDKTIKNMNNLFDEKYMNYFTDDIDSKLFGEKLSQFLNDCYLKYVYKKISPKYLHTVKNMEKFISTLY